MKTKFLTTLNKYSMCRPDETVLVAVSGGADSMCLLNLFMMSVQELGIRIEVAHVNHGIRGAEADADEEFVRCFCEKHGIPFHCLRKDIPALAAERSESIELCAREIRYEYFDSLNCDRIATAHSGSDRIETMLMNLTRGSALSGLCSIPAVRGKIIRPLIDFTRDEIESFCRENSIDYVTDSSNLTDDYTRNKIRHSITVRLSEINPSFEANALKCIGILNEENDFLDLLTEDCYNGCVDDSGALDVFYLSQQHPVIIKRVIKYFFAVHSVKNFESRHISYILTNLNNEFSVILPGNKKLSCRNGFLYFDKICDSLTLESTFVTLSDNICLNISDKSVIIKKSSCWPDKEEGFFVADASLISDRIIIRGREAGDVFHLGRRRCSKKLKKLLNEMNIPVEKRSSLIILADESGVIFVEGIGVDSTREVNHNSKEFLLIKTEENINE